MIAIDLANAVFLICLVLGGLVLLVGLLLDDESEAVLDFLRLRRSVGGVPVVAYVLAFVGGFGLGGLAGTVLMNAEALPAAGVGLVGGLLGLLLVWGRSDARTRLRASAAPKMDLDDLIGHRGHATSDLRSDARGTVSLSYRGVQREFAATSRVSIPEGTKVVVEDTDESSSTLEVTPVSHTTE